MFIYLFKYKRLEYIKYRSVCKMLSYLILVLCYFTASTFCFNSNIKISDLEECEELFLNSSSVKDVYPISCLWNNEANENEVLRMRFFVLGFDVHIRLGKGDDFTKEHVGIYISGNRNDPSRELESAICRVTPRLWSIIELAKTRNLTDNFFYTEFLLIVTKGNFLI